MEPAQTAAKTQLTAKHLNAASIRPVFAKRVDIHRVIIVASIEL